MKKYFLFLLLLAWLSNNVSAQFAHSKFSIEGTNVPEWVKMMYADNPNVHEVEKSFEQYYAQHPFEKNNHTRYYKHWLHYVQPYVNAQGFVVLPSLKERNQREAAFRNSSRNRTAANAANWTFCGPEQMYNANNGSGTLQIPISSQANVYSIDRSLSNNQILFCGTEGGGVYKSVNQGLNWTFATSMLDVSQVKTIKIHPTDPNIVLFGSNGNLYKTTNGGTSWTIASNTIFGEVRDITFLLNNPSIILVAAEYGVFRSVNGGANFAQILSGDSWNVMLKPGSPTTVYSLVHNETNRTTTFYRSTNSGETFQPQTSGWYVPQDLNENIGGAGRLAVSEADPNKIYALLVGGSTPREEGALNGFIGVYVSNDGGTTWSLPQNYKGTPYNANLNPDGTAIKPNLMNFSGDDGTYNQVKYNTYIIASHLNANKVLIGGLSTWRSDDGCQKYKPVGGYVGSIPNIHPDIQTLKNYKTSATTEDVWMSSDGGVNYSTNFFETSHESRTNGIFATDFWGFDSGWNDDVMVGGTYHNGNRAYHEGYTKGKYLQVGGAEEATGYVNPGNNLKAYFQGPYGVNIPNAFNDIISNFNVGETPNESYSLMESSVMAFDPRCYNTVFIGVKNSIKKSINGGDSFSTVYTFGTTESDKVRWVEISRKNPNYIYLYQGTGTGGKLWKTTDGGTSWATINMPNGFPNGVHERIAFTLSGSNENEIWLAYKSGADMNKVYKSTTGGTSWTNITTAMLNGADIYCISHQLGTDGGVYIGVANKGLYYRNNTMNDWVPFLTGLPVIIRPLKLKPFYRDEKIRCAAYSIGAWESPFYESSKPQAQISVDKNQGSCAVGNSLNFQFVNYSVYKQGATFLWTFPGGVPTSSTNLSPLVTYNTSGSYNVTLQVTNPDGQVSTQTYTNFITINTSACGSLRIPENPANTVSGADYKYYEGSWNVLPDFASLIPVKQGNTANYDLSLRNKDDDFAFSYTGFINIPTDGYYNFYTSSDDGSRLYIGSTLVVDNDGPHGAIEKTGQIGLKAGKHAITVNFFEINGGEILQVSYDGPGLAKQLIPNTVLFRNSTSVNKPVVSVRTPLSTDVFTAPATVVLTANASVTGGGTISKVEYFYGSTKIGESTSSTNYFQYTWSGVATGTYALTAKATDNLGTVSNLSATVNITVGSGGGNCASLSDYSPYPKIYNALDRVKHNNTIYEAVINNLYNVTPGTAEHWWKTIGPCGSSNVKPVAGITSPVSNTSFNTTANITINANASDADGTVNKVEFFQGTIKIGEDLTSPYSFTWNNVAIGTYVLTAKATDNLLLTGDASPAITVSVVNPAPTVNITSPANNTNFATVPATVTINANAADVNGTISKVEFYNGAVLLNTDITSPFSYVWSGVGAGSYALTAKAYDNLNAVTTSSIINITAGPAGNIKPVAGITSPVSNTSFNTTANITINANASDADGTVNKVEFFQGTIKIGEDLTSPYSFTWNNVAIGTYVLTAKATDNLLLTGDASPAITVSVVNPAPTVNITSPANNTNFATVPATVTINANAADVNGTISKVEFYNGAVLLNTDITSPFSYVWSGVAAGSYALTAKAYDNLNAVTTSSIINITAGTTCTAPVYSAAAAYNTGDMVQYNGVKYKANWWTQGQQPDINSGGANSGKPWLNMGTCSSRVENNPVDNSTTDMLNVFPNPTTGLTTISGTSLKTNAHISLVSSNGVEIISRDMLIQAGKFSFQWDLTTLPAGVYSVRVILDNTVLVEKLIKK